MFEGLKPCPHRRVDDNGHILCGWIKNGDNQVSVNLCRACQVPQINCQHLRAALQKTTSTPITVRFATGRVEVWDDEPPTIEFKQAACAAKTMPIHSARDCSGCPLRAPHVIPQSTIQVARQNRPAAPAPVIPQAVPPAAAPTVAAPTSAVASKAQRTAEASAAPAQERTKPQEKREPRRQAAGAPAKRAAPAQPVAAHSEPVVRAQAQETESSAAQELIARAKRMAAHKEQERIQAAREQVPEYQTRPSPAQSQDSELSAAQELIARAKRMAAQKEQERVQAAREQAPEYETQARPQQPSGKKENRSKIILLQQWLAEQVAKKNQPEVEESEPDEDGVREITYAPVAPTYAEEPGLERCVGWTD